MSVVQCSAMVADGPQFIEGWFVGWKRQCHRKCSPYRGICSAHRGLVTRFDPAKHQFPVGLYRTENEALAATFS